MGTEGPFPGGKARLGCDADHSPPSSVEVLMSRSDTSSPPRASIGALWDCFTLHRVVTVHDSHATDIADLTARSGNCSLKKMA
jgi:hypothetical protein